MRRVIWTEGARRDVERITAYLVQFSPLAAQRMAIRIASAADSLGERAERGRPFHKGWRELAIIPPYLIRYSIEGETVFIRRVRHGARRPDHSRRS